MIDHLDNLTQSQIKEIQKHNILKTLAGFKKYTDSPIIAQLMDKLKESPDFSLIPIEETQQLSNVLLSHYNPAEGIFLQSGGTTGPNKKYCIPGNTINE